MSSSARRLTGAVGRWSAGHLWTAVEAWLGTVVGVAVQATMLMVAVAVIGTLTLLPAPLALLGDRVERGRLPPAGRLRRPAGQSRIWSAVPDRSWPVRCCPP
jgi:RND superfamily putative drug exporter